MLLLHPSEPKLSTMILPNRRIEEFSKGRKIQKE